MFTSVVTSDLTRLQTLHSLAELDTASDPALNDWVKVAAQALHCSCAAVCMVDADQHRIQASHGEDAALALGDTFFHLQTILARDVLVVVDTLLDPRFSRRAVVVGHPGVRFYAAAPLRVDGHVIGVLSVAAPQAQSLEIAERVLLLDLAHAIEHWFVSRREQLRLQAREREFRELAEQMPGIVYRAALDPGCSTLSVSSRVRELGYSPQEWVATPDAWLRALHPSDRDNTLRELAAGIDRGLPFELRYRLRDGHGAWRHFRDVIRLIEPQDGDGPVLQGVMIDVTESALVQAERELLFNDLPDAVLLLDARKRITDANSMAASLLGKPIAELKGCHIGSLMGEDEDRGSAEQASWTMANASDAIEWEYWHPNGRLRTLEDRRRIVEGGTEIRVLRDVTHRMAETGWLRMLAQAAEQASESIVITDLAANIVYVNQAMSSTSGYSRAELMGRNSRILQSGMTPDARYRKLWMRLTSGKPWRGFLNNRRKDGSHYIEFAVISPIRDLGGRITHYLAVKEDITEKRRMGEDLARYRGHLDELVTQRTQELEREKRRAERANAAKSVFLASMSHEIRTPMNGVIGIADVLEQSGLNPQQKELVDTIQESAQLLLSLIDDILDFSKIEAGRLELHSAPFELQRLIEHACDAMQPVASGRQVRLHGFVEPGLSSRWMGDATRLRQIALNLAGNAIKFSAGLARAGCVSLRAEASPSGGVRIVVRDNGIGMSEEVQGRIFQPFVQGDVATTSNYGGTGLGLAICQRLVAAMAGRIVVESVPDVGSVFMVDLPLEPVDAEPEGGKYDLAELHCHFDVQADEPLQDWVRYLESAGASTSGLAGSAPWADSGRATVFILDEAHPLVAQRPTPRVLLRRARRDAPTVLADGSVRLHTGGLHRDDLLLAVSLAVGRNSLPPLAPSAPTQPSGELQRVAHGRVVLVAEDNDINQKVIGRQLDLLGVAAEIVDDGLIALQRWTRNPQRYCLLLTDLRMPEMDGIALALAIRKSEQRGERLPILALTANALGGEAQRCREAGMDGYLSKPLVLEQLREALMLHLGAHANAAVPVDATVASEPEAGTQEVEFDDQLPVRLLGDDAELLRDLRVRFVTAATRALADIERAAEEGDWDAVGATAHRVKSSAHACGATGLSRLLNRLEEAVREGHTEAAQMCVMGLQAAVQAVCVHFQVQGTQAACSELGLMCVDDDPERLLEITRLARALGLAAPRCFSSGAQALEFLGQMDNRCSLLLLDLLMPEMDGVELIRLLAAQGFCGGVALFSAADPRVRESAERLLRAFGIRSLGLLSKPVTREKLADLWDEWVLMNPPDQRRP